MQNQEIIGNWYPLPKGKLVLSKGVSMCISTTLQDIPHFQEFIQNELQFMLCTFFSFYFVLTLCHIVCSDFNLYVFMCVCVCVFKRKNKRERGESQEIIVGRKKRHVQNIVLKNKNVGPGGGGARL